MNEHNNNNKYSADIGMSEYRWESFIIKPFKHSSGAASVDNDKIKIPPIRSTLMPFLVIPTLNTAASLPQHAKRVFIIFGQWRSLYLLEPNWIIQTRNWESNWFLNCSHDNLNELEIPFSAHPPHTADGMPVWTFRLDTWPFENSRLWDVNVIDIFRRSLGGIFLPKLLVECVNNDNRRVIACFDCSKIDDFFLGICSAVQSTYIIWLFDIQLGYFRTTETILIAFGWFAFCGHLGNKSSSKNSNRPVRADHRSYTLYIVALVCILVDDFRQHFVVGFGCCFWLL